MNSLVEGSWLATNGGLPETEKQSSYKMPALHRQHCSERFIWSLSGCTICFAIQCSKSFLQALATKIYELHGSNIELAYLTINEINGINFKNNGVSQESVQVG
jgi:hypothetical protein